MNEDQESAQPSNQTSPDLEAVSAKGMALRRALKGGVPPRDQSLQSRMKNSSEASPKLSERKALGPPPKVPGPIPKVPSSDEAQKKKKAPGESFHTDKRMAVLQQKEAPGLSFESGRSIGQRLKKSESIEQTQSTERQKAPHSRSSTESGPPRKALPTLPTKVQRDQSPEPAQLERSMPSPIAIRNLKSRLEEAALKSHRRSGRESLPSVLELETDTPIEQVKRHRQPLIDKLQAVAAKPAPFPSVLARLRKRLVRLEGTKDDAVLRMKELMRRIVDPVDFFDESIKVEICNREDLLAKNPPNILATLEELIENLSEIAIQLKKPRSDLALDIVTQKETLSEDVDHLKTVYEEFRQNIVDTPATERKAVFSPEADLVGDCVEFGTISTDLSRNFLGKDSKGKEKKSNAYGNHAVFRYNGAFYKGNSELNSFIKPGAEFAVVSLLQLVAGEYEVAAATGLVKVRHSAKLDKNDQPSGYMEGIVQVGNGVEGPSGENLLRTIISAKKIKNCLSEGQLRSFYQVMVSAEETSKRFLMEHPELENYYHLPRPPKYQRYDEETKKGMRAELLPVIRGVFRAFPTLKNKAKFEEIACLYTDNEDEQFKVIEQWMDLITKTPRILIDVISVLPLSSALFDNFSIEEIMRFLVCFVTNLKKIFLKLDVDFMVKHLHNLMSFLDIDHFSASVIGHLLVVPRDAKPDNFQAKIFYNTETLEIVKIQLVGIDNDDALQESITKVSRGNLIEIECILFFLDEMDNVVSKKIRDRLISRLAIEWHIDWLKLLYDQSDHIKSLVEGNVFVTTDFFALLNDELSAIPTKVLRQILDLPYHQRLEFLIYLNNQWVLLIDTLKNNEEATLSDLYLVLHPFTARVYRLIKKKTADIYTAYGVIHEKATAESMLKRYADNQDQIDGIMAHLPNKYFTKEKDPNGIYRDEITDLLLRQSAGRPNEVEEALAKKLIEEASSITEKGPPTDRGLGLPDAICAFFSKIDWSKLTEYEQLIVLDRIGLYFPKLDHLLSRTKNWAKDTFQSITWLKKKLQSAMYTAFPNATTLILRLGASADHADEEKQTLIHMLFNHAHNNPTPRVIETLDIILAQPKVDVNASDSRGLFPLEMIADRFDEESAIIVLNRLVKRGAKLNNTDSVSGESALDRAVRRDKPKLFCEMIKLGAGWRIQIDKVSQFVSKYLNNKQYESLMLEAVALLMYANSQFAYRFIFAAMCVAKPEEGSLAIQGAENGEVNLAPGCVAQVLDKDGQFKPKESDQKGRRNVPVVAVFVKEMKLKMHLKEFPELSGREFAVGTLRRQMIGHGAPYTELFKFKKDKAKPYPVQFSKTVFGDNFHDVLIDSDMSEKVLANLDHYSISGMIVTSIFINPGDEQPANFIVELIKRSLNLKYRLECVDNDHGFLRSVAKDSLNKIQGQVISILFCLDEMLKPIHADIIDQFLEYEAVEVMREWLNTLIPKEDSYGTLFTPDERKSLLAQGTKMGFVRGMMTVRVTNMKQNYQDNIKGNKTPSEMRILIPSEFIGTFYDKLRNAHKAFGKNPYTTGMQLLKLLMPEIGVMYENVFKTHKTPLARFNALFESHYSKVIADQSFNSHRMLVSKLVATEGKSNSPDEAQVGPRQALELLELIHKESQELELTLNDLHGGQFDGFRKLQLKSHKEEIVNKIDWGSLKQNPDLQQKLLQMLCKEKIALKRLKLSQCASLTNDQLTTLLKNSPDLTRLDLSYSPLVENSTVRVLEKYAPNLEVLSIRGTLVDEWHCEGLPKLRRLITQDCANLNTLKVSGRKGVAHSSFETLVIDRCNQLSLLSVKSDAFKTLSCEGMLIPCADRLLNSAETLDSIVKSLIQNHVSQMHLESADQEYGRNNFQNAIELCDLALNYNVKNAKAFFIRASSHTALNDIDKAISDFDMAILLNYKNQNLYMLRDNLVQTKIGLSRYEKGNYSGAFSCFSRVFETDPTDVNAFIYLIKSGFESKKYRRMLANSKKAVEVVKGISKLKLDLSDDDRINCLFLLGCANFYVGNFKEACSSFSATKELVRSKLKALMPLCRSGQESNNTQSARALVDKLMDTQIYLGQCEMELNNTQSAITYFNDVIKHKPRNIRAYILRADCHLKLCDRDNVAKDYQKCLEIIEDVEKNGLISEDAAAEAKYELTIVYAKSAFRLDGNIEKAGWCAKALAASSLNRGCPTLIECEILHAQGQFQLVIDSLTSLLKQYPTKTELYLLRAKSLMLLGSFEDAEEDCKKAMSMKDMRFESVLLRGKKLIIAKEYYPAISFFKELIKRFEDKTDKSSLSSNEKKILQKYPYTLFLCYCYLDLALYFINEAAISTEVFQMIKRLVSDKFVTPPKLKEFLETNAVESRKSVQSEDASFEMQLQARILWCLIKRIHLRDLAWYKILDISAVLSQYGFKNLNTEFDILLGRVGEALQTVSSKNKGISLPSSGHSMWSKPKGAGTSESNDIFAEADMVEMAQPSD